ncbi:MAG: neutral/alkaline non-lysosomal ceramidase N-terminal domain-containing protein [Elusimicrobia bacterium]|nr:neutral/alkaline non-lysosomal ceramidase N-terminal domain-containing protein [Elusimicrobiota bacterium]
MVVVLSLALLLSAAAPARAAGRLTAAFGKADITPDVKARAVWLAGYGPMGRRARGVHDPIYARAAVFSDGERTVAVVAVDAVGIFRRDVQEIRRRLKWDGTKRYVMVAATHDHSAPDTLGLWGAFPGVSGIDPRRREEMLASIVTLVEDLAGRLEEAELTAASREVDPTGLCRDTRDPAVIDPELHVVQAKRRKDGRVLGTLVRWSCHPVALGWDNKSITADYPGELCGRIEAKGGGACVFLNGMIGGHLVVDKPDTRDVALQYSESRRIGTRVADIALQALSGGARVSSGRVSFASSAVRVPLENSRFVFFINSLAPGHDITDASGRAIADGRRRWLPLRQFMRFPLPESMRPWLETEVSIVRVGSVALLGVPGEMFPELALGGFDGRYRFAQPLLKPANSAPPNLDRAPKGPYLRQKLKAKHGLLVGLANDELGYIVPEYDFKIAATRSMSPAPSGHYDETFSVGRAATGLLMEAFDRLLAEEPEAGERRSR